MAQSLRILLSAPALASLREPIGQVMQGRSHVLIDIESALRDGRVDFDVAFLSREVTGLSTKHELTPALQAYYDLLCRAEGLRWLHIHSAGADRHVFPALRARGVRLTTSAGANADVVAQTALAGMLALARHFPLLMTAQREHRWAPLLGGRLPRDLPGQTVVLVGWGPVGQRLGSLLRALGLRLVVVRRQARVRGGDIEWISYGDLPSALPRADWLVLACPLTETTQRLVDARALAALPAGAHLVNVARGEVVVQQDLIDAVRRGHLAGAYLDVFEHEPLPADSPLWDLPNVIVTPHSAGHSDGNEARVAAMFLDNLRRWCAGEALLNEVP